MAACAKRLWRCVPPWTEAEHDYRYRLRSGRCSAHRADAGTSWRTLRGPRLHSSRKGDGRTARPQVRDLRKALRCQGGMRKGARYGVASWRVLARHGGRKFAVWPSDDEAHGWGADAPAIHYAGGVRGAY